MELPYPNRTCNSLSFKIRVKFMVSNTLVSNSPKDGQCIIKFNIEIAETLSGAVIIRPL